MNKAALAISNPSPISFHDQLQQSSQAPLVRAPLGELQVNVGRLCNQACHHCHVDAGPKRTEIMGWATMEKILAWAEQAGITKADITGGAPELNPLFRQFVEGLLALEISVTSRCNLTVLLEPGQEDLADWYAAHNIRLVCSLPCYTRKNVDAQRGKHVFDKSVLALDILNTRGYGHHPELVLDLVYNPGGASLPPAQAKLESDYRNKLCEEHGIVFSKLLTLTNLPINRFRHYLDKTNQLQSYMQLLADNFNADTIAGLMCRHLISVDWQGRVYDCDFNQMLGIPLGGDDAQYLWELNIDQLENRSIAVENHCFGCTAGAGSSCGGALV